MEAEARRVAGCLQGIMDTLPPAPSHSTLLAAFDTLSVRTLLENEDFYAVVRGNPPGIHRTAYVFLL